jgi:elongation factor P
MVIQMDNRYFRVLTTHHHTPGNLRGQVQTKLRDLSAGTQVEHRFRSDDDVDRPHLEQSEMEFLYRDGEDFHFMNTQTYEQIHMTAETLGDAVYYLVPNVRLPIEFIDGKPVGIDLPVTVDLKVVETEPELKGATASSQRKPATTETGLVIQVPPFVKQGEVVRVSTEDGTYLERV